MRILSLHPGTTELVFSLGAGNLLVGRTDACDYPESSQSLPSIGKQSDIKHETVAVFEPDLVLLGHGQEELAYSLASQFSTMLLDPQSFDDLLAQVGKLGAQLTKQVEADIVVHELVTAMEKVKAKIARFHAVRVHCDQEHKTLAPRLLNDLVKFAGGEPYVGDSTIEALAKFDPQIIIAITDDAKYLERIVSRDGWQVLSAVKSERVFMMSGSLLRPSPRLAKGMKRLAKRLHGVEVNGN